MEIHRSSATNWATINFGEASQSGAARYKPAEDQELLILLIVNAKDIRFNRETSCYRFLKKGRGRGNHFY